jgi:hypothetical protein
MNPRVHVLLTKAAAAFLPTAMDRSRPRARHRLIPSKVSFKHQALLLAPRTHRKVLSVKPIPRSFPALLPPKITSSRHLLICILKPLGGLYKWHGVEAETLHAGGSALHARGGGLGGLAVILVLVRRPWIGAYARLWVLPPRRRPQTPSLVCARCGRHERGSFPEWTPGLLRPGSWLLGALWPNFSEMSSY